MRHFECFRSPDARRCRARIELSLKVRRSFWVTVKNNMYPQIETGMVKDDLKAVMMMAYEKEAIKKMTVSEKVMLMMYVTANQGWNLIGQRRLGGLVSRTQLG